MKSEPLSLGSITTRRSAHLGRPQLRPPLVSPTPLSPFSISCFCPLEVDGSLYAMHALLILVNIPSRAEQEADAERHLTLQAPPPQWSAGTRCAAPLRGRTARCPRGEAAAGAPPPPWRLAAPHALRRAAAAAPLAPRHAAARGGRPQSARATAAPAVSLSLPSPRFPHRQDSPTKAAPLHHRQRSASMRCTFHPPNRTKRSRGGGGGCLPVALSEAVAGGRPRQLQLRMACFSMNRSQ